MPPHKKFTVNKNQGMDDTESVVQSWQDITGSLHVRWLANHKFNYVLGTMFPGGKWVGPSSRLGFVFIFLPSIVAVYTYIQFVFRMYFLSFNYMLASLSQNKSIIPRSPMKMTFPWWNIAFFLQMCPFCHEDYLNAVYWMLFFRPGFITFLRTASLWGSTYLKIKYRH